MSTHYEELLKEQVMHQLLGNDLRSLKSVAQCLINEHQQDQKIILSAYQKVNTEISGRIM